MLRTHDVDERTARTTTHRVLGGAAAALITIAGAGALPGPAPAGVWAYQAIDLVATQAAITMNGTFTPDVTPQFQAAVLDAYIGPLVGPGYTGLPLRTPQDLWPLSGVTALTYNDSTRVGYGILKDKYEEIVGQNTADGRSETPMVVFGYSQSAFIASMFDEYLSEVRAGGGAVPPTTFVQIGNTNIPNGGLMARFNGLGLTPWTPLVFAPTKTGNTTYEVFRQYDPFADFPKYTLNALAVVNSLMGYLLHFTLPVSGSAPWLSPVIRALNRLMTPISLNPASPNYVEPIETRYEDTVYMFVPTAQLPLLAPLYAFGMSRLADALDPVFRPLIEAGYDRSESFGEPTPAVFGLGPHFAPALQQSWQALRQLVNPGTADPTAAIEVPAPSPSASIEASPKAPPSASAESLPQAEPVAAASAAAEVPAPMGPEVLAPEVLASVDSAGAGGADGAAAGAGEAVESAAVTEIAQTDSETPTDSPPAGGDLATTIGHADHSAVGAVAGSDDAGSTVAPRQRGKLAARPGSDPATDGPRAPRSRHTGR